jgi:pimeloyl-ACP methyl ester carboxylesterase
MELGVTEAGSGEPLVLLHGIATNRTIWDDSLPLLATRRRAIAIDVPGFGESEPAGDGFDLEQVAAAIAAGIEELGVREPYDVVGQSLGGALAIVLGAHQAGSIRRIIAGAPAGFVSRSQPLADLIAIGTEQLVTARRLLGERFVDSAAARRLFFLGGVSDGERLSPERARVMLASSRTAKRVREAMATIVAADLRPELRALRAPLGLIWGSDDITVPIRVAADIQKIRPGTPLEMIPRTAHIPHVEAPSDYADAVWRLVERLPAR